MFRVVIPHSFLPPARDTISRKYFLQFLLGGRETSSWRSPIHPSTTVRDSGLKRLKYASGNSGVGDIKSASPRASEPCNETARQIRAIPIFAVRFREKKMERSRAYIRSGARAGGRARFGYMLSRFRDTRWLCRLWELMGCRRHSPPVRVSLILTDLALASGDSRRSYISGPRRSSLPSRATTLTLSTGGREFSWWSRDPLPVELRGRTFFTRACVPREPETFFRRPGAYYGTARWTWLNFFEHLTVSHWNIPFFCSIKKIMICSFVPYINNTLKSVLICDKCVRVI